MYYRHERLFIIGFAYIRALHLFYAKLINLHDLKSENILKDYKSIL